MNISYTVNFNFAVFLSYDLVHNTDGLEDFPDSWLPGLRGVIPEPTTPMSPWRLHGHSQPRSGSFSLPKPTLPLALPWPHGPPGFTGPLSTCSELYFCR